MDKNYIITSNGGFVSEDELAHHGILGMRWGRRRYQNSDGSLTAEGRERYGVSEDRDTRGGDRSTSKETNPRKSRGTGTDNSGRSDRANKKEATKAKNAEEKAKKQEEKEKKAEEKKDDNTTNERRTKLDGKSLDEISDKNLNDRLNRMRNEDAYDKMMVERGYVQVEKYSDMDRKISELKKQKEYAELLVGMDTQTQVSELSRQKELKELQRDIKKLDKELNAKEKSKMQQLGEMAIDKVAVPAVMNAGEKVLEKWLTDKGMSLLSKDAGEAVLDKAGSKIVDKGKTVAELTKEELAKQAAKEATKQAKAEAKAEAKAAKQAAKEAAREAKAEEKVYEGEVIDTVKKSVSNYLKSGKSTRGEVIDVDYEVVSDSKKSSSVKSTASIGQKSVSGYLNSPPSSSTISLGQKKVSGYLTAPKTASSSTIALGEIKVAGLLNAPASSSSSKKFATSITRNATGTTARIKSMKATGNYTNAEIAKKLGISESTVNNYLYGGGN